MSHPAREPFSREFTRLDPQARLDEFQKRFDRLKSEFNHPTTQRPMFESVNRFANQPPWTGPTNENINQANGHVPTEKTIPIHVQHERSRSEPMDGANQASNSPNMAERRNFMPDNAYFQPKFQHPFANVDGTSDAEPRVHHIPIQVESRSATSPPMAKPVPPTHPHPQQHQSTPSQASAPNQASFGHPIQPAATTSSFTDSKPTRFFDVPIQITKSSSTPETSKKSENVFQQSSSNASTGAPAQAASVSEATSDPAIADPNKVYAMGYEPLQNGDNSQQSKANAGEAKKETPFDFVKEILDDLKNYESQVHEFNGNTPEDKGYRWLDEMLTLCILRLDCINIDGNDELRKYRKSAINEVNRVAAILEAKVNPKPKAPEVQSEPQNAADTSAVQSNSESTEAEDSKDKKDSKKAKGKKDKDKNKKESGEKKEGRRIILFRGKSKNKATPAATETANDPNSMDVDPNNNDLKDDQSNQSTSDQNSEAASTSSSSTLQGKETAV